MTTLTERMRALRERGRHGSEFHNSRNEDDLRVIAEHGYEGVAITDHDRQAQAVSLFITDMLAASIGQGNGVTATALKRRCKM
jgi:hypothetical protein